MIRLRQIKIPILNDNRKTHINKICKVLKCKENDIKNITISKKSIDARDKNNILYIYEFDVELSIKEDKILNNNSNSNILKTPNLDYEFIVSGDEKLTNRIVIVGSGPAGLICAYLLSNAGYKPLVIEQGSKMEERIEIVNNFFKTNALDLKTNIQFGEGGAGTFSDGKLNTLVKDKLNRGHKLFEIFVENGAPKEIMYEKNPHIGTDILRDVVTSIRNKIIKMGGEFLFNTKLTDLVIENHELTEIIVNDNKKIPCNNLILAIGHSSRDTFYMLHKKGVLMKNKNFAVGLRIIHPQEFISKSQYGSLYKYLPPANYKLTHQCQNKRGVYTFCMCPGGYVINSSSKDKCLVVNGMSNYKRDSGFANSAIVVSITQDDYGKELFDGIKFQEKLEEKAYSLGNGYIPVQSLTDYLNSKEATKTKDLSNCVLGKYHFTNLNNLFNSDITNSIKEGINSFDKKIKGYIHNDSYLLGVESRTSSPVVIIRDESLTSNIKGIYPCGEGAGYAGGITTAAIDGMKVAEVIAKKYKTE